MKVLTIFGTRPEAIKLAPVLRRFAEAPDGIESVVCVTGQHRQMLDQVLTLFDIRPDYDLDIMRDGQDLFDISTRTLGGLKEILSHEKPDVVLVQGDTTSAFFSALAAFYRQIPIGHVEAGLRTANKYDPFPEEMNRTLISALADHHFAPTALARNNLVAAGIPPSKIHLTGNTVVDAIRMVVALPAPPLLPPLRHIDLARRRLIVLTTHRRESFGRPMRNVFAAIGDLLSRHGDLVVVFPMHLNPNVRAGVKDTLCHHERLVLLEPLPYEHFAHLLKRAYLIVTDSGGIQEEASALGKPVVVVRETTERVESVDAGVSLVVGREQAAVVSAVERLLGNEDVLYQAMTQAECPYGDGEAARRVVDVLTRAYAPALPARRSAVGQ